jgi:UDP-2,3-diacylglucosamine hydrolase
MAHGRTLFISDLHLDAAAPATIELFMAFLRGQAHDSDALYILGDMFETWIGDDDEDPARQRVIAALRALTASGVPCFIQHGNRDFLLGADFLAASGCSLLPDPAVLDVGARRFVLTHGDQLCTQDRRYQRFRHIVRNGLVQGVWRTLPLALRRRFAATLRRRSHVYTTRLPESISDVTPAAVRDLLLAMNADVLVHGHTHRPNIHRLDLEGRQCTRIVLGDWPGQATVLVVDAQGQFSPQALAP